MGDRENYRPEIDVVKLMQRIRAETSHDQTAAGERLSDFGGISSKGGQPPPTLHAAERSAESTNRVRLILPEVESQSQHDQFIPRQSGVYALDELTRYDGPSFIRIAYQAVLWREPDVSGFNNYLQKLRSGATKLQILEWLLDSGEGRARRTRVTGLKLRATIEHISRLPLIGPIVGLLRSLSRIRSIDIKSQTLATEFAFQLEEVRLESRANVRKVHGALRTLERAQNLQSDLTRSSATRTRSILEEEHRQAQALSVVAEKTSDSIAVIQSKLMALENTFLTSQGYAPRSSVREEAQKISGRRRLDEIYAGLEQRFRGEREDIRQRQSIYLKYVREAELGTAQSPILDLGAGRGEWLELLRDEGLVGAGVDSNVVFTEYCSSLGLEVANNDVFEYLRGIARGSVGAITCFHLVEHLAYEALIALFDEVLRVLRSGGLAIFETPNPQNILVGSCNFYLDPTHKRPLPPELCRYLVEACGFCRVEIRELHPASQFFSDFPGEAAPVDETFGRLLYSFQDYAIVCRKA